MSEGYHWVTLYTPANAGYHKIEWKLVGHGDHREGRSQKIPFVDYIPRGKRKTQTHIGEDFVILEGVGHPDPPSGWIDSEPAGGGVTARPGDVTQGHAYRLYFPEHCINGCGLRFGADNFKLSAPKPSSTQAPRD